MNRLKTYDGTSIAWIAVRVIAPFGLATLAVLVVADRLAHEVAIFVVGAAVLGLVIASVSLDGWRKLGARLETAELFGVAVGLGKQATEVRQQPFPKRKIVRNRNARLQTSTPGFSYDSSSRRAQHGYLIAAAAQRT